MPDPCSDWRMPQSLPTRRESVAGCGYSRARVDMLARFRHGITSSTVVLKDLTPAGARVDGVGALEVDEVVSLALPGCRPTLAYVAWANAHCAGLRFVEPLAPALFVHLVEQYGLAHAAPSPSDP